MRRHRIQSRQSLAEQLAEDLLSDIVRGIYAPGSRLPPEPTLAEETGVSRLTLREAVKNLCQRGVLRVEQGRGTFVNPLDRWSPFDAAVLAARAAVTEDPTLFRQMIEIRRIVEVGVAGLAAGRRSDAHLTTMESAVGEMREAMAAGDLEWFTRADMRFHDAIMTAAENPFTVALFEPIRALSYRVRRMTSETSPLQERAFSQHVSIMEAIRQGDATGASGIMDEHLRTSEAIIEDLATKQRRVQP